MGTNYKISISEPLIRTDHSKLFLTLDFVNQQMSTYIPSSLLSKLNSLPVGIWLEVSNEFIRVVDYSQKLCFLSEGAFDVSVGNIVNAWGFGPKEESINPLAEIKKNIYEIGCDSIEVDKTNNQVRRKRDVYIDLSGVAKGFAIDYLAESLEKLLIENYLIELGGEIRAKGLKKNKEPWIVGIEHPEPNRGPILTLRTNQVSSFSLATSGNYRNFKKTNGTIISHIFDPRSGKSVINNLSSVSVLSESVMESDALATTLNVLGKEKGLEFANQHKIRAIFITLKGDGYSIYPSNEFRVLIN